ncbi:MAG: dUTP diphosphatase, partial [bacterium]
MISAPIIKVQLLRDGAQAPEFMSASAAGADLRACLDSPVMLNPGKRTLV